MNRQISGGQLSVLIVDDEQPARRKIRGFLQNDSRVLQISEAENGVEAVERIQQNPPDLVFLDIQMPGMTGFEVLENIGAVEIPAVIFVTAYDEFAIAAFEVEAVDYLLKPFDRERLHTAFQRATDRIHARVDHSKQLKSIIQQFRRDEDYPERIMVSVGKKFIFVHTAEIQHISAEEKYVNLHTSDGKYLLRETMSNMEKRLDPRKFARIHRSAIVNLEFIKEIQSWSHGDYIAILKNGKKLTVSRRYKNGIFK